MKKALCFLLLAPIGLFAQTKQAKDSSTFLKCEFIDIGKLEGSVDGNSRSNMLFRVEYITNLRTGATTNAVAIFIDPRFVTIEGTDVDSLVSALKTMTQLVKTTPANTLEMAYKCNNGFAFQLDWADRKWYASFSEYTNVHHYSVVFIDSKDIPNFIALLAEAKTKFK